MAMPSPPPSGRQFEIARGDQRAVVVEVGGGLRTYHAGGLEAVDGYAQSELCDAGRGQLLLPWPNRIRDGRYSFSGVPLQLALNEPERGNAIHGLARWHAWAPLEVRPDQVTLALSLPPQPGYPFALDLKVLHSLTATGLRTRVEARNAGSRPCPYGAGAHPYVFLGDAAPVDGAQLRLPARSTLESDARGIPTGRVVPVGDSELDFRTPRRIGSTRLDTAFTDLEADGDGVTRATLTSADGRRAVTVWMDVSHDHVMLYTGDALVDASRRRRALAIEPMTCAPDAFNSGRGLRVLEPGERFASEWGISVSNG